LYILCLSMKCWNSDVGATLFNSSTIKRWRCHFNVTAKSGCVYRVGGRNSGSNTAVAFYYRYCKEPSIVTARPTLNKIQRLRLETRDVQTLFFPYIAKWESGSSISMSDYELDDRAIGVRSPAEAKDFSSNLCVQTGSEAHQASCTVVPEVLSPGQSAAGE
jgi:hypothetical protein